MGIRGFLGVGGGATGLQYGGVSEKTYVEELFSTSLYTGTGSAQTIDNGIDLSGEGGMTWIKARTQPSVKDHIWTDTVRGAGNALASNNNASNTPSANNLSAFNSNGFSVGTGADVNENTYLYTSWSFRKAPGFFDIVTYTGTGSAQNISHSLGSIPGCILVKKYDGNEDWLVYHRGMDSNSPEDYALKLNTSGARFDQAIFWNDTAPTDSIFTVGGGDGTNENNKNYVAYLFAHNDGDGKFGKSGNEDIIKCGSYIGNGSQDPGLAVNLGWEPQWWLVKRNEAGESWYILDSKRGWVSGVDTNDEYLSPDTNAAEASYSFGNPNSTGFDVRNSNAYQNYNNVSYTYIAIRAQEEE